jgi:hypothetical protein
MRKNTKRGRPAFKPTPVQRRKVSVAAGAGMAHEEIAIGLGISRNTLEKHFAEELSVGAYSRRLEVLDAMHRTAVKGNVAAQKAYVALTPAVAVPPVPAEKPKGKKEQAQAEAQDAQAGTSWEELLPTHGNVTPIRAAG